jgi:hypothetical protein
MTHWGEQRNIGLDACTGDFIISVDADMGWTGNLGWLLSEGYFNSHDVWDFRMYFIRGDLYHHDGTSYDGLNRTTRLIKNCGVRYSGAAHEQPDEYTGENKTSLPKFVDSNAKPSKGYCKDVHLLHLSALASDEVQVEHGFRVIQRWSKQMTERGISPGNPYRYLIFKYKEEPPREIPEPDRGMIPTMAQALKLWGKRGI